MAVYLPPWAQSGCTVTLEWCDAVQSGDAMGLELMVEWTCKKGKVHEMAKRVIWYPLNKIERIQPYNQVKEQGDDPSRSHS